MSCEFCKSIYITPVYDSHMDRRFYKPNFCFHCGASRSGLPPADETGSTTLEYENQQLREQNRTMRADIEHLVIKLLKIRKVLDGKEVAE